MSHEISINNYSIYNGELIKFTTGIFGIENDSNNISTEIMRGTEIIIHLAMMINRLSLP